MPFAAKVCAEHTGGGGRGRGIHRVLGFEEQASETRLGVGDKKKDVTGRLGMKNRDFGGGASQRELRGAGLAVCFCSNFLLSTIEGPVWWMWMPPTPRYDMGNFGSRGKRTCVAESKRKVGSKRVCRRRLKSSGTDDKDPMQGLLASADVEVRIRGSRKAVSGPEGR